MQQLGQAIGLALRGEQQQAKEIVATLTARYPLYA